MPGNVRAGARNFSSTALSHFPRRQAQQNNSLLQRVLPACSRSCSYWPERFCPKRWRRFAPIGGIRRHSVDIHREYSRRPLRSLGYPVPRKCGEKASEFQAQEATRRGRRLSPRLGGPVYFFGNLVSVGFEPRCVNRLNDEHSESFSPILEQS